MGLTNLGHTTNGVLSMIAGILFTQPLFAYKTYIMAGRGLPPINRLWAGYGANILCSAPSEGVTFATYHVFAKALRKEDGKLTQMQNFLASITSGIIASPFNASCENGMIQQQLHGGKFIHHMQAIFQRSGWQGMFRGSAATAGRDGIFSCGVFYFNDMTKDQLTPVIRDKTARDLIAGITSGVFAGFISTPFDLGKTLLQADERLGSSSRSLLDLVKKEGTSSLFRGAVARSLTVGSLICALTILKEHIPAYFPSSLKT